MLTTLKKRLAVVVAGLALALVPMAVPVAVSAQSEQDEGNIQGGLTCGANFDLSLGEQCDVDDGTTNIQDIITTVVNIFSIIVAIVAVIMIIWGGFKYVTSGGDSGNITTAKNTIIYAIIGLVIVALAQFLVQFVLSTVTNA
jgi:uncharacterized membrane protein YidH (DUF202 family)